MTIANDTDKHADRVTVFLSYARADKSAATTIVQALEAAGFVVQWDGLLHGGAQFARAIEDAIVASDVVVVAWSKHAVASDWVRDEAAKGRDMGKLVAVSLDGTEPPLGFGQYHAVDLRSWRGRPDALEFDAVIRGIAAVKGREQSTERPRPPVVSIAPSRRRLLVCAAGVTAAGIAGVSAWRAGLFSGDQSAGSNSIAVLPFMNLSSDPQQAYFSDGVAEEVRITLTRQSRYRVMGKASSGQFRDRSQGAIEIAKQLGVAFLLDGSVRRSGDVVRVVAELIDGATGLSRWAQSFDRRLIDIFAVQSEIANTVVIALTQIARVPGSSAQPIARSGGTTNVAAYDAYLRGRALYELGENEGSDRAALAQFDAAIAIDPGYAAAHAARARALLLIANLYDAVGQHRADYDASIAAAQRAISLAPDLAEPYSTLGLVLFQGRLNARAAEAPFQQSLRLGAGEAAVLTRYALYAAHIGNDRDARDTMQRALALDPLDPLGHLNAGAVEYAARRYAAAIPLIEWALRANPRISRAHGAIGDALLQLGRTTQARAAYLAEPVADTRLTGLAIVAWKLRDHSAARDAMTKLLAQFGDIVLYQQGQILAQWNQRDAALTKLERARELGDSGLIYARNDPLLDPLRGNARFLRLLTSIGFA